MIYIVQSFLHIDLKWNLSIWKLSEIKILIYNCFSFDMYYILLYEIKSFFKLYLLKYLYLYIWNLKFFFIKLNKFNFSIFVIFCDTNILIAISFFVEDKNKTLIFVIISSIDYYYRCYKKWMMNETQDLYFMIFRKKF